MPEAFRSIFLNEGGLRAGWRLLIFAFLFAALSFAVVFPLSRISRLHGQPGHLVPSFVIVGDGVTFLVIALATWVMSRIERRSMGVYGLPLNRPAIFPRFIKGWLYWGFLPLSVCLLTLHFLGAFDFGGLGLHGSQVWLYGFEWLVAFLLVGFSEEYLLRGYALYTLADGIGFWPAAMVLGILFGLGHAGNPGETRVGVIATVVFAIFACVTVRLTGDLWLAVGAHAGWDWGQSFFYGVSDSGITAEGHLLNPKFHGPVWLTGGSVGPEGSVITLILWSAMMLLFYLIYRNRREPALVMEARPAMPPPMP